MNKLNESERSKFSIRNELYELMKMQHKRLVTPFCLCKNHEFINNKKYALEH